MGLIVRILGLPKDKRSDEEEDEGFVGNQKGVQLFRKPQRISLIDEKTLTNTFAKYANFADVFSLTLGLTNILSN